MKLMLTSAGVRNESLKAALRKLVGGDMRIAFIPTAANIEKGDKGWLIDDFNDCRKLGVIDIVDISALKKSEWLPRLEWANVIFVGGGHTEYLMHWVVKSGLNLELKHLLENRVYVGSSSGGMILSDVTIIDGEKTYSDDAGKSVPGLGYINFHFRPHFNSPDFPKAKEEFLKEISGRLDEDLYAMDDESGIVWVDGEVEVVGEGKWVKFSKEDFVK